MVEGGEAEKSNETFLNVDWQERWRRTETTEVETTSSSSETPEPNLS